MKSVIQALRLTPRSHEGQHVVRWRIDVDVECRLRASQDAFGNIVHSFSSDGPHSALTVTAVGEVETFDTRGIVAGSLERFPPELYLRSTSLTQPTGQARGFAERATAEANVLDRLHALLRALREEGPARIFEGQGEAGLAREPSGGKAMPLDIAHFFIACSRLIAVPARYVGGYRLPDAPALQQGPHGWAEAFVPGLGWVGFDPVNGLCPDDRYVRVAIGLDALGASATRGAHAAGADPPSEVKLSVTQSHPRGHG